MKIGDLFVKLGLQKGEFDKGLNDAKQQTNAFGNAIKKVGGIIAGVFAADKIIQFGKDVFNIATQAEGVQTAFSKIATSGDLDNLRNSVKGTVSDLELMKRSVMASNFGIPVQELGRLFEFAAKRAQDTGQSIDYLVDSIVIGIGRKSPLILDNLGISIQDLRKRMGGLSAETATVAELTKVVGDIAEESLSKYGRLADNLGTKVQTLSASWENLKLTLSGLFSNSQWIKDDLDDWDKLIKIWQDKTISGWQKYLASVSQVQADKIFKNKKLYDDYAKMYSQARTNANVTKTTATQTKQDPIVKTAVEQLAAIRKVNEELEAQRILRQEFRGQKIVPMTPIGTPSQLQGEPIEFSAVFGNLDSSYESVRKKNKQFTDEFLQDWKDFSNDLNDTIKNGLVDAISSLASGLGELAAGAITSKEFGNQILQVIGGFMQTLGSLMIAYAINMALFAESAKNPLSWPVALAAGIALVGAGAAISGFAKKGLNSSSSASSAASGYRNYSQSNAQMALAGNVVFELQGDKLKGVLNNTDRKNRYIR